MKKSVLRWKYIVGNKIIDYDVGGKKKNRMKRKTKNEHVSDKNDIAICSMPTNKLHWQ